jgi:tetratricopeptide (TPR) repeat protein
MRCKEFNQLLNDLHGSEPTGTQSSEMDAHRASCARCAGVWQAERMLRAMFVPPTPLSLLERICAFIDEIAAGTIVPFPVRRAIIIASLVLIGAAAAATTALVILEQIDRGDTAPTDVTLIEAVAPIEPPDPAILAEESASNASDDTVSSASEAAESPSAPPAVPVGFNRVAIEAVATDDPAPVEPFETEAVDLRASNAPIPVSASEIVAAESEAARSDAGSTQDNELEVPDAEGPELVDPAVTVAVVSPAPQRVEVELPAETPALGRDWLETRAAIDELMAEAAFDSAAELGQLLLSQIRAEFGDPSTELADAHSLIAKALRAQEDYVGTEIAIVNAIGVLESIESAGGRERPDPTQLIDALLFLGDTYDLMGEYAFALETYEKARDIGRRKWGLQNLDQIEIIERMTDAYVSAGALGKAEELQIELLRMVLLVFGDASEEAIEAHHRYARWLRQHLEPGPRKRRNIAFAYTEAERIIRQHFLAGEPVRGIQLLMAHATEVLRGGPEWGHFAAAALRSARQTYHSRHLDNPLILATIARDLGDWYVLVGAHTAAFRNFHTYAFRNYREAWVALGSLPIGDALREKWFAPLTVIYLADVDSRALSTELDAPKGYVAMELTIDVFGRARVIEVIDSEPDGLLVSAAKRLVAGSRFRPRIVDGEAVVSRNTFYFQFRYDAERVNAKP